MALKITITSDSNWGDSGNGTISLTNEGSSQVSNWSIKVKIQGSLDIQECWNMSVVKDVDGFTLTGKEWNRTIDAKQTITSGFSYKGTGKFTYTTTSSTSTSSSNQSSVAIPPTTNTSNTSPLKYKIAISKIDVKTKKAFFSVSNVSKDLVSNALFEVTIEGFVVKDCKPLRFYRNGNDYIVKCLKIDLKPNDRKEFVLTFTGDQLLKLTSTDPQVLIVNETDTTTPSTAPASNKQKKIMGYLAQWDLYDRKYPVETIPGDKLTHIMYAFCLPNPNQEDYNKLKENYPFPPKPYYPPPQLPEGSFAIHDEYAFQQQVPALMALKQKFPHLKICISLGGWTLSWTMSKVMATPALRTEFIKSSVDAIIKYGFDGFDLDWEYPGKQGAGYNIVDETNDKVNVATFFKELRKELQVRLPNKYIELSVASGANKIVIPQYKDAIQYLDYFNLMTYDFYGSWGNGGHLSGLYQNPAQGNPEDGFYIDAAVKTALSICPKEKLCIGVPFYARGWQCLIKDSNNPTAPIIFGVSSKGPGLTKSQNSGGEPGLTCWKDLRDFIGKNNNIEYFDDIAKVPYVHNITTGETWTYDNPKSIQLKMQYVKEKDLAGVIIWQLSDDVRDGKNSLLDAVHSNLIV